MKKQGCFLVFALIMMCVLTGCATTLHYTVERPAELDLRGANTIAVLPFETSKSYDDVYVFWFFRVFDGRPTPERIFANEFTQTLTTELLNSNYLQVVGSKAVESAIRNRTELPCDVYLTGYISRWDTDIRVENRTNSDDTVTTQYYRYANATINYQVIDAQTNAIICYRSKDISATSRKYDYRSEVIEPQYLLHSQAESVISQILRELQPYTESKVVSFMEDKTKDEVFKAADTLAKKGFYEDSRIAFMNIYKSTGMIEAGFNAARILQVQGKLQESYNLLSEILKNADEKQVRKVKSAMNEVQYEIRMADELNYQKNAKASR